MIIGWVSFVVWFRMSGILGIVPGFDMLITFVMETSALPAFQSMSPIVSAKMVAGAVSELMVLRNALFPLGVIIVWRGMLPFGYFGFLERSTVIILSLLGSIRYRTGLIMSVFMLNVWLVVAGSESVCAKS